MNIAIFTNNYLPNPYGVSVSIETFRREFEKLGHKVYIFAPHFKEYQDKNPNVFRYPSLDINIKFRFPLAIPYSRKMDAIISSLDLDVIHSQHPNLLGAAAMKWARRKKIPLIFTWHTLYDQYTNFAPFIPAKISAGYMIKKAVKYANRADAVIAPTDSIIPILKKWGVKDCHAELVSASQKNIKEIPKPAYRTGRQVRDDTKKRIYAVATGVIEEEFFGADRDIIRKKYKIADDEILLLLASRLTEEKNIVFVFDSVKEILKNNERVKFLIVGSGYLKEKIAEAAKREGIYEKIFFSGEVPHNEVKNYFAAADIFVYGSKSETQGMFTMEAMYCGLPVVAVDATGTNSLVKDSNNGFLVSEKEEKFAKAVRKLIENKELREKFSQASRKIVRESFASLVCARKMLEVYENCIN